MVDQSNIESILKQEISRRKFLRFGSMLPLCIGAGGLTAALIAEEATARISKHHKIAKANSHYRDKHHSSHSLQKEHHSKHHHHNDHYSKNHHRNDHRHRAVRHNDAHRHEYYQSRYYNERNLHLYNIHTDETVNTVYWADGHYLAAGLRELNNLMRDHYTGDIVNIDPRLFDLLYTLCGRIEYGKPFHILSGYRCPATNSMLREQGGIVASHSLHMDGMAVDLRTPGLHTNYLRKAAMDIQYGGVGYYPYSDFVHVDTGPVRHW
ncbi:zinc D-Ala-D-Ala carboxypeptidase [Gammaproteobacteria bacterium]